MLVLTRKLMEKLFIGDDICVTVVRLEGGQVRLGIEAPREIAVVRAELVPERRAITQKASARPLVGIRAGAGASAGTEIRSQSVGAHGIGNRRPGRSQ
ncbi:carbon storage regulator [Singulisphaera acidiphila]|uniref:Translational regulator CsrA n=1 Tax=Singulisphaera acidiphila (strain ATCC BAA-1392 / DSM 18658 / VKM B-2454 / MOB10) TaxID=886293 RepID=L0DL41_SINAD|nr:carbon storage regulator [Singulisphaera acidiphila]AGA29550.1 carbon storage regulator (could also regulate swarming and quorum sensing) [Singulisphaera acidiphila DSM 18658]